MNVAERVKKKKKKKIVVNGALQLREYLTRLYLCWSSPVAWNLGAYFDSMQAPQALDIQACLNFSTKWTSKCLMQEEGPTHLLI